MAARQRDWPRAMTTTSTHDTKRGEDVRARIGVLAELPEAWARVLDELLALAPVPDPGFGALLWQAALGAWPISRERLHAYAEKAMREAGDHTTWTEPDVDYEAAVHRAVGSLYEDPRVQRCFHAFLERIVDPGWSNALAAKLVALTMPGVPDVYQGSELWEQSLVDPDNRRPVDFAHRVDLLAAVSSGAGVVAPRGVEDPGVAKLLVVHRALTLRRDRPELFSSYAPIDATGGAADHVLAFDRGGVITVATRLPVGLATRGGWGGTTLALPAGSWRDVLTGGSAVEVRGAPATSLETTVLLRDLLATYPVALLVREER
jgi:(1->4)-alpha-D-glucan 1-alpha-D-glucosylmutase